MAIDTPEAQTRTRTRRQNHRRARRHSNGSTENQHHHQTSDSEGSDVLVLDIESMSLDSDSYRSLSPQPHNGSMVVPARNLRLVRATSAYPVYEAHHDQFRQQVLRGVFVNRVDTSLMSKKSRRLAHLLDLIRHTEINEEDYLPIALPTNSPFAPIFTDSAARATWYEFIARSETSQYTFLNKSSNRNGKKMLSGQLCYSRIERPIRHALKRMNDMPVTAVEFLEQQLLEFLIGAHHLVEKPAPENSNNQTNEEDFELVAEDFDVQSFASSENSFVLIDDSGATNLQEFLQWQFVDSFLRMLGHALCQYYGVKCTSFGEQIRTMKVFRPNLEQFTFPSQRFSEYLVENRAF